MASISYFTNFLFQKLIVSYLHIIELLSWDRIIIITFMCIPNHFNLPLEVSAHCTFCYFPLVLFVLCHFLLFPISYTAWTVFTDFTVSLPKTAFKHVLKWLASYKNKNKKTETWICLFYLKGKWKQMGPRIFFLMKKMYGHHCIDFEILVFICSEIFYYFSSFSFQTALL